MLTKSKIAIVAAFLFGSASGAFAQSYDPSVGSGNIGAVQTVVPDVTHGVLGSYAQVPSAAMRGHAAGSLNTGEKALFERIRPE